MLGSTVEARTGTAAHLEASEGVSSAKALERAGGRGCLLGSRPHELGQSLRARARVYTERIKTKRRLGRRHWKTPKAPQSKDDRSQQATQAW